MVSLLCGRGRDEAAVVEAVALELEGVPVDRVELEQERASCWHRCLEADLGAKRQEIRVSWTPERIRISPN